MQCRAQLALHHGRHIQLLQQAAQHIRGRPPGRLLQACSGMRCCDCTRHLVVLQCQQEQGLKCCPKRSYVLLALDLEVWDMIALAPLLPIHNCCRCHSGIFTRLANGHHRQWQQGYREALQQIGPTSESGTLTAVRRALPPVFRAG